MSSLSVRLAWIASVLLGTSAYAEETYEKLQVRILDVSGNNIAGVRVNLACESTHTHLEAYSDEGGIATFPSLPVGFCSAAVAADKFEPQLAKLEIKGELKTTEIVLRPLRLKTEISVEADPGGIEIATAAAATIGRERLDQLPLFNRATGFTDILTRTTPGVAADSNGFAHPLGEHADTSISLDGQPITDQQAKVFANQLNPDTIEAFTAITGAPPAEFGGKTSLVISVTTKSGLGSKSTGFLQSDWGNLGTLNESGGWAIGSPKWGNFLAITGTRSERFLDSPESVPLHDTGNNGALFNRTDWHPQADDLIHWNALFWPFLVPNAE